MDYTTTKVVNLAATFTIIYIEEQPWRSQSSHFISILMLQHSKKINHSPFLSYAQRFITCLSNGVPVSPHIPTRICWVRQTCYYQWYLKNQPGPKGNAANSLLAHCAFIC